MACLELTIWEEWVQEKQHVEAEALDMLLTLDLEQLGNLCAQISCATEEQAGYTVPWSEVIFELHRQLNGGAA